ncbi:MAG: hypothetical protein NVSMB4_07150 [Acidimicrobiales bacterium]
MAVTRLDNLTWGFASKCFVCEPSNDAGLRIPFFHDDEAGTVSAEFTLDERFSGAPSYVHGGMTLAILDEAMAWATIAVSKCFALTHRTTTTFIRPVKVGRPYRVEARIARSAEDSDDGNIMVTASILRGADAKPCAEAEAIFVPLSAAQATDAIGTDIGGSADAGYLAR